LGTIQSDITSLTSAASSLFGGSGGLTGIPGLPGGGEVTATNTDNTADIYTASQSEVDALVKEIVGSICPAIEQVKAAVDSLEAPLNVLESLITWELKAVANVSRTIRRHNIARSANNDVSRHSAFH
jgi:hypothetical protein